MNPLLDPGPASAAGRAHGQIASALAGGGLAISAHKLVEIGARAQLLVAPGVFRFDARPEEDGLQVFTRALGPVEPLWLADDNPPAAYGTAAAGELPYGASWRLRMEGTPPLAGRVLLLTTFDAGAGLRHFTVHAVVVEEPG